MKNFLFAVLFSFPLFAQISPIEFPKIGYFDMYILKYESTYWGSNNTHVNYSDSSWFYPALQELGLTHIVTHGDAIPYNTSFNPGIKIIDNLFMQPFAASYIDEPFKYANACGNHTNHYAYELGGSTSSLLIKDDKFGFGAETKNSIWAGPGSGAFDYNKTDPTVQNICFYAEYPTNSPGQIVHAELDPTHQPYKQKWGHQYQYRFYLNARIDGSPTTENILKVHIYSTNAASFDEISGNKTFKNYEEELDKTKDPPPVDFTFYIRGDQLTNAYNTFVSNYFIFSDQDDLKKKLVIDIDWLGHRSTYLDNFAISNSFYKDLFVDNSIQARDDIKSGAQILFGPKVTDPLFCHPYFDEPFPMNYRGVGEVSNLLEEQLAAGKYVNGATMGLNNHYLMLANSQRRLQYVLYDYYPILSNTSTSSIGSNNIQNAFDRLIDFYKFSVYGGEIRSGLRHAIQMAQNYTLDNTNDDVPFYHTIQVNGEKTLRTSVVINDGLRPPTPNEIIAQGFLTLCYGAKGIMYYTLPTNTPKATDTIEKWAQYGIFEEVGNFGALVQNPENPQCRNERYWAVKKLNSAIDRISSELLQLNWKGGFSLHRESMNVSYLSSVQSYYQYPIDNWQPDLSSEKFVELGVFEKTSSLVNDDEEYFMLVNRRTLPDEQRKIKVTINKSGSVYNNWKVVEVGSFNEWIIGKTSYFQTIFQPGEGKLFRLEPVMIAGGSLITNESVPSNTTLNIKGSINVPAGKTLTVNSGCNLNFPNGTALTVSGNINVIGISNSKVTFDFEIGSLYGGEGAQPEGIKIYGSPAVNIQHAIIKNAPTGLYIEDSEPGITYTEFLDCANGLYLKNCNYTPGNWYGTMITNCSFHDNVNGLYLTYSSPYLTANSFVENEVGVNCSDNSSPFFGELTDPGVNYFYKNSTNVYSYLSTPVLGVEDDEYIGGYNTFEEPANYHMVAEYMSTVMAENNCWIPEDSRLFKELTESTIDYSPSWDCRNNAPIVKGNTGTLSLNKGETVDVRKMFLKALKEMRKGKKENAKAICKKIIKDFSDDKYLVYPFELLFKLAKSQPELDSLMMLNNATLLNSSNIGLRNYSKLISAKLSTGNYVTALNNCISNSSSDEIKLLAMYRKFVHYFNSEFDSANAVFNEIASAFPDAQLTHYLSIMLNGKTKNNLSKTTVQNIEGYLIDNYPNPFNPVTVIRFNLPQKEKVSVTVFDMLGKEIKVLVDEIKDKGLHEVEFFDINLASGIYFVKLQTNSFIKTQKIVLMK